MANRLIRIINGITNIVKPLTDNPALVAESFNSAEEFAHEYFRHHVVRKFYNISDQSGKVSRRRLALSLLDKTNDEMALVNQRCEKLLISDSAIVNEIISLAEQLCRSTLGSSPSVLPYLKPEMITSGASYGKKRSLSRQALKLTEVEVTSTALCARVFDTVLTSCFPNATSISRVEFGNEIEFVPKSSTIDRVIAKEAMFNMAIQRALGLEIADKLATIGMSPKTTAQRHQKMMFSAVEKGLATVDLENASNSISLGLCSRLLPRKWYLALLAARADTGVDPDGGIRFYNFISTMGNGYTFELETLLFWALSKATCMVLDIDSRHVSVFGDDIIVPTEACNTLGEVFSTFGIKFNPEKTFTQGPFRESCGMHTWHGIDVSPIFMRPCSFDGRVEAPLVKLFNRLSEYSWRYTSWASELYDYVDKHTSTVGYAIPGYTDYLKNTSNLHECRLRWSNSRLYMSILTDMVVDCSDETQNGLYQLSLSSPGKTLHAGVDINELDGRSRIDSFIKKRLDRNTRQESNVVVRKWVQVDPFIHR